MHNVGEAMVPDFFAGYGLTPGEVDETLVRYYILLDELQ
jgi:hypothetical protein